MPYVCVFDVNETLLDLSALDPHFERAFGDASVRRQWFTQMLQSAFVSTITRQYATFATIGAAALEMVAMQRGVALSEDVRKDILGGMRALPPHADVVEALDRLKGAGFRLATLTNSAMDVAEEQMANSGLRPFFEQVLSADMVERLKPAAEPYQMAAVSLGVPIERVLLIAAHSWDCAGAQAAGCAAAFVGRPGQVLDPLIPRPLITGADLREVAERILALE